MAYGPKNIWHHSLHYLNYLSLDGEVVNTNWFALRDAIHHVKPFRSLREEGCIMSAASQEENHGKPVLLGCIINLFMLHLVIILQ